MRTEPTGRTRPPAAVAAVAVAAALALLTACGDDTDDADRQEQVAARGAEVMPFDLDATTHRFAEGDDGLVETVIADDPHDTEQVDLIRDHLAHEAGRFAEGDYGDPAAIHGHEMPGLAELEAGAEDIAIGYDEVEAGARIAFTTTNAALVDALHRWGEAQVADHGAHDAHG